MKVHTRNSAMRRTRQNANHVLINNTIGKFRYKLVSEGIAIASHANQSQNRKDTCLTEQQGILDIWIMLDRAVRNKDRFPSFPTEVIMDFEWVS
jgi:hypothetical protein